MGLIDRTVIDDEDFEVVKLMHIRAVNQGVQDLPNFSNQWLQTRCFVFRRDHDRQHRKRAFHDNPDFAKVLRAARSPAAEWHLVPPGQSRSADQLLRTVYLTDGCATLRLPPFAGDVYPKPSPLASDRTQELAPLRMHPNEAPD